MHNLYKSTAALLLLLPFSMASLAAEPQNTAEPMQGMSQHQGMSMNKNQGMDMSKHQGMDMNKSQGADTAKHQGHGYDGRDERRAPARYAGAYADDARLFQ